MIAPVILVKFWLLLNVEVMIKTGSLSVFVSVSLPGQNNNILRVCVKLTDSRRACAEIIKRDSCMPC